MKPTSFSE